MNKIRVLLDEDVWPGLAIALREHSFDVIHVYELGREGMSDSEQLAYAVQESRAIFTHNVKDFVSLATTFYFEERSHSGIIVARQLKKGELIKRTLNLLNSLSVEDIANTVRHLSDFK